MDDRIARSLEEVAALEEDWRRLSREEAAPFATFAWNIAWLRAFGNSFDEIAVFVRSRDGRTVAIVPFYRQGRELRFVGDDICDYQDVIAADAVMGQEAFEAAVEHAMSHGLVVRAPQIATGTLAYELLSGAAASARCCRYARHYCPVPFMEMEGSWDEFRGTLSKNLRADVKRRVNRMRREKGEVETRFLQGESITREVLDSIGALHARNQHRKGGASLFSNRSFMSLLLEVAGDAEAGLHVSVLEGGGEMMAFILGFLREKTYYLYLTAYEGSFESYAPGKVLIHELVKHLVEKGGVGVFDFLNGPESYKYQWAKSSYDVYEFTLSPPTRLNRVKTAAKISRDRTRKAAKRALVKTGIYGKLTGR